MIMMCLCWQYEQEKSILDDASSVGSLSPLRQHSNSRSRKIRVKSEMRQTSLAAVSEMSEDKSVDDVGVEVSQIGS